MLCKRDQGWSHCVAPSLPTEGAVGDATVEGQTLTCGSISGFQDKTGSTMKTREERNGRRAQTHVLISFLLSRLDWQRLHFTLKLVHLHVQRVDHVLVGRKHIGHVWHQQLRFHWSTWVQVRINSFNYNAWDISKYLGHIVLVWLWFHFFLLTFRSPFLKKPTKQVGALPESDYLWWVYVRNRLVSNIKRNHV